MSIRDLLEWVKQAVTAGIIEFSFTGGEPFLAYDVLHAAVSQVAELQAKASVITNAFWAIDPETALRKLEPLRALRELSISADRFHQEHIDLERVRYAITAARTVGIPPRIKIAYSDKAEVAALQSALAGLLSPDEIDADPIHNIGRMAEQKTRAPSFPRKALQSGCQMTRILTVVPEGNVYGCCGPILALDKDTPLCLGSLREKSLPRILQDLEFNVIYHLIRIDGPYALYQLVKDEATFDLSGPCSLCYDLSSRYHSITSLAAKANDPSLFRRIAVERLLYLNEPFMLSNLQDWAFKVNTP